MVYKKLYLFPTAILIGLITFAMLILKQYNISDALSKIYETKFENEKYLAYYSYIENNTKVMLRGRIELVYLNSTCHNIDINFIGVYKNSTICCYPNCIYLQYDPYLFARLLLEKNVKGVKVALLKVNILNKTLVCEKSLSIELDKSSGIFYCLNENYKIKYFKIYNYTSGREIELIKEGP